MFNDITSHLIIVPQCVWHGDIRIDIWVLIAVAVWYVTRAPLTAERALFALRIPLQIRSRALFLSQPAVQSLRRVDQFQCRLQGQTLRRLRAVMRYRN